MTLSLRNIKFPAGLDVLLTMQEGLVLINTINAHSYNISQKDFDFAEALLHSDVLLPDGAGIVKAVRWLRGEKIERIAGWDLFVWEMKRLNNLPPNPLKGEQEVETPCISSVLFMGSTEAVLSKIKARAAIEYPNVEVHTYSPPYKPEFSDEDNRLMCQVISTIKPDVLFVGMTAPKQEKWAYRIINNEQLIINNCHICCIGAVFDFYAGTVKRAPIWWQRNSLEWLYRLMKEPRRMWRRYLVGNVRFLLAITKEWIG